MYEVANKIVDHGDPTMVATLLLDANRRSTEALEGGPTRRLGRQACSTPRFHLLFQMKTELLIEFTLRPAAEDEGFHAQEQVVPVHLRPFPAHDRWPQ